MVDCTNLMDIDNILFEIDGCRARQLQPEDGESIQLLAEACEDYYQMNTALPPGPAEAQSFFIALPEGKNYDDKFLIGIFSKDNLVGILDAIKDYKESGEWTVGLLMLHPTARKNKLGSKTYKAFEKWAVDKGASAIRIGVLEYNEGSVRFWRQLGFDTVERRENFKFGERISHLLVMKRKCA